jgi:hypothetical protein
MFGVLRAVGTHLNVLAWLPADMTADREEQKLVTIH